MPRHRHRPYPYGGGGGGRRLDGASSNNYGSNNHFRPKREDDLVCCTYCQRSLPRFRFPSKALIRYDKRLAKLARGESPATIKVMCHDCCRDPGAAISNAASSRAGERMPKSEDFKPAIPLGPERRGQCTKCWLEYPLILDYFPQGDTRDNAANRRACWPCRRKEELIDEGFDAAEESEGEIRVWESDDDEEMMPIQRIEDQPLAVQQRATEARKDFASLTTKLLSARSLVQKRRMRGRFVPSRALLLQQRRDKAREQHRHVQRMSSQETEERNRSLRKDHGPVDEADSMHPDARQLLQIFEDMDFTLLTLKQDDDFQSSLASVSHLAQQDEEVDELEDDDDDDIPAWHLTEAQKRERLERLTDREADHEQVLRSSRAQDGLSRVKIEERITSDLLHHYQEHIVGAGPLRVQNHRPDLRAAEPTTFDMACLLSALEAASSSSSSSALTMASTSSTSRSSALASTSASASSSTATSTNDHVATPTDERPSKRVHFEVSETRAYW
ncbi:hypothetical protein PSEUBRA_001840 [Kalmanozyma brasiliensis GHG001]|uniref:uncharacterized protein n=1 Tax=Kalmanozyma brasiliensis (strain GHG001) TaxID=1365824 RepID=UPI002867F4C6|nr:uncharacterized protein PSEUBRA_001840 [Kalmanozyma brasiliensis GHG001]KAF6767004.1 hypothetical protein PSEUBRA_001840 [Kalmanozyma brasiliensis GHG001]